MSERLRQAAQTALAAIQELEYSSTTAVADAMARKAKQALRAALAEREWTPDDTAYRSGGLPQDVPEADFGESEPVAIIVDAYDTPGLQWLCEHPPKRGDRLYTHPPRREWQTLTDEEMHLFASWLDEKPDAEVFAAIETTLKEKNHG